MMRDVAISHLDNYLKTTTLFFPCKKGKMNTSVGS